MGYLIDGYKIMGQELKQGVIKHRAGIATGVSIVGTIVSNILSTKAGAKSARMIDAKAIELGRPLTLGEKVKLCWQNHIGAVAVAGTSVAGSGYSHSTHVQDFNKVATAYAGMKKLYDSGKQATKEVLGEKKNAELQDKLIAKKIEEHPEIEEKLKTLPVNPDPHTQQLYLEETTGEFIYTTKDKIELALTVMRNEMKMLKPRKKSGNGIHGVNIRRFFILAAEGQIPRERLDGRLMSTTGFNKGKEEDGSDDDYIDVEYIPRMSDDLTHSYIVIDWIQEPCDMTFGDQAKL